MAEYRSSWWSIDLLPGWSAEQSPECVSFYRDDGVGPLQISAYKHDRGAIPPGDLDDLTANEFPDDPTLEPVFPIRRLLFDRVDNGDRSQR